MANQKEIVNDARENQPSDVPDKNLPQSATWGFPAASKKGDDGVSTTSTWSGTTLVDRTDRGADWPDTEIIG